MDIFNKKKIDDLNTALAEANQDYLTLFNEKKDAVKEAKEAKVLVKELETKLSNFKKTVNEITEESVRTFKERDSYKSKCEEILNKYKLLSCQKGGLVKEKNKLKDELLHKDEELAKSVNLINDLNAEINRLNKKPEVPTINELETYKENPKLAARKRKGL